MLKYSAAYEALKCILDNTKLVQQGLVYHRCINTVRRFLHDRKVKLLHQPAFSIFTPYFDIKWQSQVILIVLPEICRKVALHLLILE